MGVSSCCVVWNVCILDNDCELCTHDVEMIVKSQGLTNRLISLTTFDVSIKQYSFELGMLLSAMNNDYIKTPQ